MKVTKTVQSIKGADEPVEIIYYTGESFAQVTSALAMIVAEVEEGSDYFKTLAIHVEL